jgi:hypothetical protein
VRARLLGEVKGECGPSSCGSGSEGGAMAAEAALLFGFDW